ncbi:hypothetical protein HWV62_25987 [Athelia sp. TMB]|nr:hypothetical protein HWV62_25987 [Athelia sp. TMB]
MVDSLPPYRIPVSYLPGGLKTSEEISVVMATAMAVGASSSDLVQTHRTLDSPDGQISVICTQVSFTFCEQSTRSSPYVTPEGMSIAEATAALLLGDWPYQPQCSSDSPPPPISIPTTPSSSPCALANNTALPGPTAVDALCDLFDEETASTHTHRVRRTLRRRVAPAERWYCITRGLRVGVIQGA